MLKLENATISFGGIDLSSTVADIELPGGGDGDSGWASERIAGLKDGSLTFSGHWDGPMPLLDLPAERAISVTVPWHVARRWLELLERRRRARVRRMRSAYHRRRGSGRW